VFRCYEMFCVRLARDLGKPVASGDLERT
jgi:hypothetical protein